MTFRGVGGDSGAPPHPKRARGGGAGGASNGGEGVSLAGGGGGSFRAWHGDNCTTINLPVPAMPERNTSIFTN